MSMRAFWGLVVEVWQAVPSMLFGPYIGREEAVVRFKAVVPSVDEQTAWIEAATLLAQVGAPVPSADDVALAAWVIAQTGAGSVEEFAAGVARAREEGWL